MPGYPVGAWERRPLGVRGQVAGGCNRQPPRSTTNPTLRPTPHALTLSRRDGPELGLVVVPAAARGRRVEEVLHLLGDGAEARCDPHRRPWQLLVQDPAGIL